MTDRDFLIWIHERLVNAHDEDELVDYLHRLRQIIYHTDLNKTSRDPFFNSMEDLKIRLGIK